MTAAGLLLVSFLSGAAGLIYEVLWARRLSLVFGSTALAQTLTLAGFLGGLALGAAKLGRRADAAPSAARFYARLEWAIAALGLLAPAILGAAGRRLGVPALIAQAFLMGGTLPALCRAAGGETQRSVGRVYGSNSAGAALGCLLAAFALIPWLGLSWSFWAAAALNAAAGALAWRAGRQPAAAAAPPPSSSARAARSSPVPVGLVLAAVFVSGCAALVYEVAWTRLLALVLGSSVYSFAEMLAALIAGLSLGGAVAARASLRRREPARLLGAALAAAGASVLLSLPLCGRLGLYFVWLRPRFGFDAASFYAYEAAKFAVSFALLLIPAACLGMTLPLAARLAETEERGRGGVVGAVLAANAAGNVLGAFAGFWLLPALGVAGLLRAGTTVHLLAGAAVLWAASSAPPRRRAAWALAALAAWSLARARLPRWDPRLLAQGTFRITQAPDSLAELEATLFQARPRFYRDDREATVAVFDYPGGSLSLRVNGKTDASTGEDMRTQIIMGELPLLLAPSSRRALLVGWGSGVTAGSMLRHPLERLDAVELLPSVVASSRLFASVNGGALDDPRLSLRVEDAKTFLARPGPRYDVIVSEPSNPWMAGVADLFTRQFYERARARLAPGGMMVQWFHIYEMDDELLELALRTFRASFPNVTLWTVLGSDVLLVGSERPLEPDFAAMQRVWGRTAIWRDYERAGMTFMSTLLAHELGSEATTARLAGDGPLHDELRPELEYSAPKALFARRRATRLYERDDRADPRRRQDLLLARYLKWRRKPLEPAEYADRFLDERDIFRERPLLVQLVAEWRKRYPRDPKALEAQRMIDEARKRD